MNHLCLEVSGGGSLATPLLNLQGAMTLAGAGSAVTTGDVWLFGTLDQSGGSFVSTSAVWVAPGGALSVAGDGAFSAAGSLSVQGSLALADAGAVSAGGCWLMGHIVQSGGSLAIADTWSEVGAFEAGAGALYEMSGGTLTAVILSMGGGGGTATFVQTGGAVDVWNLWMGAGDLGPVQTGHALYQLLGGTFAAHGQLAVGEWGAARFEVAGGAATVDTTLVRGVDAVAGALVVSAGSLTTTQLLLGNNTGPTAPGAAQIQFVQAGGAVTVVDGFSVGWGGGNAAADVSGGTLAVNRIVVGGTGTGVLRVSAGAAVTTNELTVGVGYPGYAPGDGSVEQTGGTVQAGWLSVAAASASPPNGDGSYALAGGALTVGADGRGAIADDGAIAVSGTGVLSAGTVTGSGALALSDTAAATLDAVGPAIALTVDPTATLTIR